LFPKHLFVRDIIEPRKPLAPTARRAGWLGCNIRLDQVPEAGKVWFVREGAARPREAVLEDWREMLFLRRASLEARGWLVEVLRCVEAIGGRGSAWPMSTPAPSGAVPWQPQCAAEDPPAAAGAARRGRAEVRGRGAVSGAGRVGSPLHLRHPRACPGDPWVRSLEPWGEAAPWRPRASPGAADGMGPGTSPGVTDLSWRMRRAAGPQGMRHTFP